VPITFTCGGTPTRVAPNTQIGKVCVWPELKLVITKSSIDSANDSRAPARIPGKISGRVTLRKVAHGLAPRSWAASSRVRSKPARRARTVTAT
jgi:hypothetical protein